MHDYARHLVASVAAQVLPCRGSGIKSALARQFLPYCISPVSGGFILLNREYKPLGWPPRRKGHVDYNDPMFASTVVDIDPLEAMQFPLARSDAGDFYYLYGQGIAPPWRDTEAAFDYCQKLRDLLDANLILREGASP